MGSLYEEIGGAARLRPAVTLFSRRVLADPLLAPWFAGVELPRLRAHQQAFLTAALGGPDLFTGRDMTEAHAGLGITGREFDQFVSHLAATLRDLGAAPTAVARVCRRLEGLRASIVDRSAGGDATIRSAAAADETITPAAEADDEQSTRQPKRAMG
jgi:hemoglobin